jgi:hypothetical protein
LGLRRRVDDHSVRVVMATLAAWNAGRRRHLLPIVLKTKPVQWFDQKKPKTEAFTGFLIVTGPTKKKPKKLHKNNVFSRGDDPKT